MYRKTATSKFSFSAVCRTLICKTWGGVTSSPIIFVRRFYRTAAKNFRPERQCSSVVCAYYNTKMLFSKERLRNYVRFMQFGVVRFGKRQHTRCPKVEENLHRCQNLLHRPARTVASDRVRRASRQVKCVSKKRCHARTSPYFLKTSDPQQAQAQGPVRWQFISSAKK